MNARENLLRAVRFERPEYIPAHFHINPACWHHYPHEALQELMAEHTLLFPNFQKSKERPEPENPPWQKAGKPYTDSWGCVWSTTDDGITGSIIEHPLETWDGFENYAPPDPEKDFGWSPIDWQQTGQAIKKAKANGELAAGGLRHGHTFLTLTYIRGYQNVIFDMVDDDPRFRKLLQMVEDFNAAIVQKYLSFGVEWMGYPEDLGMQNGPMLSPAMFRKYIKPVYQRLINPAREAGSIIHMHSDGDIRALVDDLIDGGVEIVNLQDLVNGIDWIRERLTGKVCVDLDIDRQQITRFGTPEQIDALIREEVEKLGSREGGLTMIFGLYPGTPLQNVKALMDAMEKYMTYYA